MLPDKESIWLFALDDYEQGHALARMRNPSLVQPRIREAPQERISLLCALYTLYGEKSQVPKKGH